MSDRTSDRLRATLLAAALAVAATVYLSLFVSSETFDLPTETALTDTNAGPPAVRVYLEAVAIDTIRDSIQLRVSVQPGAPAAASALVFDRDLLLILRHDRSAERIVLHAGQPPSAVIVELDLHDGDVNSYPVDIYRAGLVINCLDAETGPKPVEVTLWDRVLGFRLRAQAKTGSVEDVEVALTIRRTFAFRFFAIATYTAMAVLAGGALTIGTLIFLRLRRPEPTMVSALGAIVFALPALRNALPGSPPLGVLADVFVFFSAELITVVSLAMTVMTWALKGPRP